MAHPLTKKTIYERMIEWRNLKKLHQAARERIAVQETLIKEQTEQIQLLKEKNALQEKRIETLTLRVEELERMIFGRRKKQDRDENNDDSSPFPSPSPAKAVRHPVSYHRRIPPPEEVTKEETHQIAACPHCATPLTRKTAVIFYEEDIRLPEQPTGFKDVTKHTVEKGYCNHCRTWRPALPIPPTSVILGPKVRAFVAYASTVLRLSYEQILHLLHDLYAFPLSQGEISGILEKEALKLTPAYERLKEDIRNQPGTHYDETGWPVQQEEKGSYAWVMTGTETPDAVFLMGRSRGKGNAEELRGNPASPSVGITDDYGAYRKLFDVHQLCWAHPLRKLRDLAKSDVMDEEVRLHCRSVHERFAALYQDLRAELVMPFDLAKRTNARIAFIQRFQDIALPDPRDPKKLAIIKDTLRKNSDAYFVCLLHDGIPPDNNKAERALRHVVLKRKISFGSLTQKGADTFGVLASVVLSLWWRKPKNFFQEYLALRL